MSVKEVNRLEIIQAVIGKRLTQISAAEQLSLSRRQIIRLCADYKQFGAIGLVSKRRGKPSNNRLSSDLKNKITDLIKSRYADFGPTLAHEKLTEHHHLTLSVESCRKLMLAEEIWQGKKRKKMISHQLRARRPAYGELVQIDGSPHAWFEDRGPSCTLLVFVDDATGKLMQLYFEEQESSEGYMTACQQYMLKHGKPLAYYSDRHSIFRVNQKNAISGNGETQFSRAMRELDIRLINANSPQAKGRVERMNASLQDRLVKELRLQGISDRTAANAFVPTFIDDYNRRFAVPPASPHDAHRPFKLSPEALNLIFCHQYTRIISKNLEVHYENKIYQIKLPSPSYTMRNAKVQVCHKKTGITLLYKGKSLPYAVFEKQYRPTPVVSSKHLNNLIENQKRQKPTINTPWRKMIHQEAKIKMAR